MDKRLKIAQRLIEKGMAALEAPRRRNPFTGDEDADRVLNNIEEYPHVFVLGCIADRGMLSQKSWLAAYQWCRTVARENKLTFGNIRESVQRPGPRISVRGRYPPTMTGHFYEAVKRMDTCYEGDAGQIWQHNPVAATVVRRFLEFGGIGPKIANMATHILLRDFKVRLRDKHMIDMPVDSNVIRVFERLGLIPEHSRENKRKELIICTARELCPGYPAVFDTGAWEIGSKWCGKRKRHPCPASCNMIDLCPGAHAP